MGGGGECCRMVEGSAVIDGRVWWQVSAGPRCEERMDNQLNSRM